MHPTLPRIRAITPLEREDCSMDDDHIIGILITIGQISPFFQNSGFNVGNYHTQDYFFSDPSKL